jgi:hypothetical protein
MHVGGHSRIIALGDFQEGKLWLEDIGSVDIRHKWLDFDGRKLHKTEPHIGERYSLIYFAHEVSLRENFYIPVVPSSDTRTSKESEPNGTNNNKDRCVREKLEILGYLWPEYATAQAHAEAQLLVQGEGDALPNLSKSLASFDLEEATTKEEDPTQNAVAPPAPPHEGGGVQ